VSARGFSGASRDRGTRETALIVSKWARSALSLFDLGLVDPPHFRAVVVEQWSSSLGASCSGPSRAPSLTVSSTLDELGPDRPDA